MKLLTSKAVKPGDNVVIRTNKIIRCPAKRHPLGTYTSGEIIEVISLTGETVRVQYPAGIKLHSVGVGYVDFKVLGKRHLMPVYS